MEAPTYNNVKEAKLELYEQTILPEAENIKTELNHWLMPKFGDYTLDYDKDSISALQPRRDEKWKQVQDADFLTINEKREALGFEHVDGGDEILVPAAMK